MYFTIQGNPELIDVDFFIDAIDFNGFEYIYYSFTSENKAEMRMIANGCEKKTKKKILLSHLKD